MSDQGEDQEKPFAVEKAKTGRAKCKKCKCPIDKDTVRIAKLMANPFGEGKMKAWHHVTCLFEVFAKQRASTKRIDDPEDDIDGWNDLNQDDQKFILNKLRDFNNSVPFKNLQNSKKTPAKSPVTESKRKRKQKDDVGDDESGPSTSKKLVDEFSSKDEKAKGSSDGKLLSKDNSFREFQRLCTDVSNASAYTEKTAIVRRLLTKGTSGGGFESDIYLWCKLLLPGVVKRIYNLQSKQLVKLFARIFLQDEDEMLEHLEQGDVAETISTFYEKSSIVSPSTKSTLSIQEVDQFLGELCSLTKEVDQIRHFKSILGKCTANDLKMIIRLIKHDLRINAGAKHILDAVDQKAYEAFQVSRDLKAVIERCLSDSRPDTSSNSPLSGSKVALSLMTPVLPMLAEACTSVEMAMKKCPNGMLSEIKYDGERVQVHKNGNEFRYYSRSLKPVLPHKVNHFKDYIPKAFPGGDDLILDAEVLMIDNKNGQPLPFGSLGIHKKAEFKDANVCLFVFDCIYYNGEILMTKTMRERRNVLKEKMTEIPNRIVLSEVEEIHDPQDLSQMIAKVLKLGLEGLVLKDINSRYEPGKRHWLKVKRDYLFGGAMADSADLVVLGAWYGTGQKGGMMSVFLMGCYDDEKDQWLTVTKVHTGHDDATLAELQNQLDMVKIGRDPNLIPKWMKANKPMVPDFVAKDPKKQPVWEITGAEFTNQGVHTADGISIRFPRVTRIRDDKNWRTATNLKELKILFQRSSDSIDYSLLLQSKNGPSTSGVSKKIKTLDGFVKKEPVDESPRKRKELKTEPDDSTKLSLSIKKEWDDTPKLKIKQEPIDDVPSIGPDFQFNADFKIKSENKKRKEAEYYAFIGKDYIEYTGTGSPLNWIDGRKPAKGLPMNAKPLPHRTDVEFGVQVVFQNVRALLANDIPEDTRGCILRTLKTLGAKVLRETESLNATHVIHNCKTVSAAVFEEELEVPKSAWHVTTSWVEKSAAKSKMLDIDPFGVELTGVYCECVCTH